MAKVDQTSALSRTDVADVWGIGPANSAKLRKIGIQTALQCRDADDEQILKLTTIVGLKLVHELRGTPAIDWKAVTPPKKGICVSRSFGEPVTTLEGLQQALAAYVSRAAEKLRRQKSLASVVTIFFHSNPFNDDAKLQRSGVVELPCPTATTNELIHFVSEAAARLYRDGFKFKKAGVLLSGIVNSTRQLNLFYARDRIRDATLMSTLDRINHEFGSRMVRFGAEGIDQRWAAKFEMKSPRYTTRWEELPKVG